MVSYIAINKYWFPIIFSRLSIPEVSLATQRTIFSCMMLLTLTATSSFSVLRSESNLA